jgi:hypothetical protein
MPSGLGPTMGRAVFMRGTLKFAFSGAEGSNSQGPKDCTDAFDDKGNVTFPGTGWKWDDLEIDIPTPPEWIHVHQVIPSVFFTKIYNVSTAIYAGWDIEFDHWSQKDGTILLNCKVRVSDNDGWMCRADYHVDALGDIKLG